jgi:acetyl-CoA carboxylase biotin carboxyl carrier protein
MDIRTIKKLIELINKDSDIGEIEIKEGDKSIRVSRHGTTIPSQQISAPSVTHHHITTPAPPSASDSHQEKEASEITGHPIKSPMVGTAYLAPTPGAKSFVELGQYVEQGQDLCIIEAMKMFNQIEADKSGVIKAILIENEQPVEYDQVLFIIEGEGR